MNSTTRYILTVTVVGVGLFAVGAAANAIARGEDPTPSPIGDPVVVPTSSPEATDASGPEEVAIPEAADLDDLVETPPDPAVIDTGGWATSPGSPSGDDDDHDDDHEDEPDDD
jgi:hypothetical protein